MKKTCMIIAALVASSAMTAHAYLYEGFTDYTSPLANQNGGTGWSGAWAAGPTSGGAVTGSSTATIGNLNMSRPSDYGLDAGASSLTDVDGSYMSDVGGGAARIFDSSNVINLAQDGTRYFSILFNESGSGSLGNLEVAFMDNASFSRRTFSLTTASSVMTLRTDNGTSTGQTVGFTAGQDYLLLGKIQSTAAGADTVSFSIFQNGSTIGAEPVTWQMSANVAAADQGVTVSRLFLGGSGNSDRFDEIRMGDSFASVTAIPEPSSLILMVGGLVVAMVWRRRR